MGMSLEQARTYSKEHGFEFYFDWEAPRTDEGYYKVEGSVAYCVSRALAFSNYSDNIWMETPTPDLSVAQEFAKAIHRVKPHVMLSYNLSPSFNWDAQKMTEEELEIFIPHMASMGYCW